MIKLDPAKPRGIVWIASYPRSGNTWTRVFLHALRRIMAGVGVADLNLNELWKSEASEISLARYEDQAGKSIDPGSAADVAPLRPRVQAEIASRQGLAIVKTHNARLVQNGFPLINPEATAGAVYIVRNPLDVAVSYARHRGYTIDRTIEQLGLAGIVDRPSPRTVYWIPSSWSDNVRSWTAEADPAVLVLRYEDLVAHPEPAFRRVAAHLRLAPTPQQLRAAVEAASFANLRRAEQRHGFAERPLQDGEFFREGRAGAWRGQLSQAQVERIVADHREQMARFSYLP